MITKESSLDTVAIQFKEAAANSPVTQLQDELVVGLRSGTTTTLAVAAIEGRVQEGLRIVGVPTSQKTADKARVLSIPLSTLHDHPIIDLSIDGADEVEAGRLNLIGETKVVSQLGSRSGWKTSAKRLEHIGVHPTLRIGSDCQISRTAGGHYILECALGPIHSPQSLQADLDSIVGVVKHGLFIRIAYQALVGGPEGVKTLNRETAS